MVSRVLITGSNGFVGSHLVEVVKKSGIPFRKTVRHLNDKSDSLIGEINHETDWSHALKDIETVVHLAARVHVMDDRAIDPLDIYRRVNTDGTINLARQAAQVGVRRLIFISSIKVNGEITLPGRPFCATDEPAPADPYAVSKWEAEQGLRQVGEETGLEVVIIRPPLVYGPGVRANFLRLMKAVQKGLPLPFGLVRNKRSLVAVENLVDLIVSCIKNPAAAGKTFLVSDAQDLSTPELIQKLARFFGRSPMLLPVPPSLLKLSGYMVGKGEEVDRLIGCLQVDIQTTCETLGWRPPVPTDDALLKTVQDFLLTQRESIS